MKYKFRIFIEGNFEDLYWDDIQIINYFGIHSSPSLKNFKFFLEYEYCL